MADLCSKKLHLYIDEELKSVDQSEEGIRSAINKGFTRLEEEWVNVGRAAFTNGFPKTASVGSCALVTIVIGNKAYIANCGDSKAVMISDQDGRLVGKNISKTFNARKKDEQARLRG